MSSALRFQGIRGSAPGGFSPANRGHGFRPRKSTGPKNKTLASRCNDCVLPQAAARECGGPVHRHAAGQNSAGGRSIRVRIVFLFSSIPEILEGCRTTFPRLSSRKLTHRRPIVGDFVGLIRALYVRSVELGIIECRRAGTHSRTPSSLGIAPTTQSRTIVPQ